MNTPLNSELLTVPQVAELLQVPVSWVRFQPRLQILVV